MTKVCQACGTEFARRPRDTYEWFARAMFCSRKCVAEGKRRPADVRLFDRVDRSGGPSSCWTWSGDTSPEGYGRMRLSPSRKRVGVHRLSWELANGAIPPGLEVCHHCDNPPCVNPAHLFLGTRRENAQDASRKGRLPKGPTHWRSHLNPNRKVSA